MCIYIIHRCYEITLHACPADALLYVNMYIVVSYEGQTTNDPHPTPAGTTTAVHTAAVSSIVCLTLTIAVDDHA